MLLLRGPRRVLMDVPLAAWLFGRWPVTDADQLTAGRLAGWPVTGGWWALADGRWPLVAPVAWPAPKQDYSDCREPPVWPPYDGFTNQSKADVQLDSTKEADQSTIHQPLSSRTLISSPSARPHPVPRDHVSSCKAHCHSTARPHALKTTNRSVQTRSKGENE